MLALKAEHISKQYRLGQVGTGTLSHDLNRFWHQIRGKENPYLKIGEPNDRASKGESQYVWSLRDINFEITQGDAVGIIGRNGTGKSTRREIYIEEVDILNKENEFLSSQEINFIILIGKNTNVSDETYVLVRILDDNEQPILSTEVLLQEKNAYFLTIPQNLLVKGIYSLNMIIFKPKSTQFDNVTACDFVILNNNEQFSHLENFAIGGVHANLLRR